MSAQDIEVNISNDEPEIIIADADEILPSTPMSTDPQDGVAELRRQLDDEKAARAHAETTAAENARRAADAEQAAVKNYNIANKSITEAQEREYESIVNAHTAEEAKLQQLRSDLVRAQADGDFEKIGDIQVAIGRAAARVDRLEEGRATIEAQRKNQPAAPERQAQPTETQAQFNARPWNNQEAQAVMASTSPQTAAWMRNNPRYFTDPAYRQQVQGADSIMRGRGVAPDTAEYFSGVETLVNGTAYTPPKEEHVSTAARGSSRTSPTAAAPPSRNVPQSDGQPRNSNVVTLTKEQREIARIMFRDSPNPEKAYAIHWNELKKEGRLKDGGVVL